MSDLANDSRWRAGWFHRLVANPRFQGWASGFPLTRAFARRDGAEMFDLVQGFVQSQVLMALVELDVFRRLRSGPMGADTLGRALDLSSDRMALLLQAGAALGLLKRRRDGRYSLARKGAALMGVPGLEAMIRHHGAFYRDLADPVALLRGKDQTELSQFWPYVFGVAAEIEPAVAQRYSDLMAQSQSLVAQDTLRTVGLNDVTRLLDVGGGSGAFLAAAGARYPKLSLDLFDLPEVSPQAVQRFAETGVADRATVHTGSFREDPLPKGADAISLVRVCYDHADETVTALLSKIFDTLPSGGRLIISEPMAGGSVPSRSGDIYFAFYTLAMQTGRARSAQEHVNFCEKAGFKAIKAHRSARPFVTSVVTAQKP